ncbi:MAG: flagellar basal body P-ring formation chaperone FlgA [Planctomycetota bacterium]
MIEPLVIFITLAFGAPGVDASALTPSRSQAELTTTVAMHRSTMVAAHEEITLGDLADIEGPLADELVAVVLAPRFAQLTSTNPPGRWRTMSPSRVRAALAEVEGLNLGRVRFTGDTTHVRLSPVVESKQQTPESAEPEAKHSARGGTVHAHVLARIRSLLDASRDDLRISFDPGDTPILATSAVGRTVEIRPLGTSERMPFAVTIYERDRIVASGTVTARVNVRRETAVTSAPVAPGETIDGTNATLQSVWVAPDVRPALPDDAFGAVARSKLAPGRTIEHEDITSPTLIARGDRIQVHAVGRGLVVRMPGRARANARAGETFEVELIGRKRIVTCRAEAEGRAVLVVDEVTPESSAIFAGPPRPGRGDRTLGDQP